MRLRGASASLATLALATVAGACSESGPAAPANELSLGPERPPSAADCGFSSPLPTAAALGGGSRVPAAGTYRYSVRGSEDLPDARPSELPATIETAITPTRRRGDLLCFGVDRPYSPRVGLANVYIRRGDDIYVTAIRLRTPNYVTTIKPRPAILAVPGAGERWRGTFRGATSGEYRTKLLGRRTLSVAGERVEAFGVQLRAQFSGASAGSQRTRTWLAMKRPLVLAEQGELTLRVGGATNRLRYGLRLRSRESDGG